MKCSCGKECVTGRCKSCSNRDRAGKYKWSESAKENRKGSGNPKWAGDMVSFRGLHSWVRRSKPKTVFCERCGNVPPFDVANISGHYHRDINDFEWLCRSCHMNDDGRKGNLKQYQRGSQFNEM